MKTDEPTTSTLVLFGRVFWIMIGPMLLVVFALTNIVYADGWLAPSDIGFLIVLIALPLARWIEFAGGNPRTSTGEPATSHNLHRYTQLTIILGVGGWVLVNLLGNYWLGR